MAASAWDKQLWQHSPEMDRGNGQAGGFVCIVSRSRENNSDR
jgi:hypothetical protein